MPEGCRTWVTKLGTSIEAYMEIGFTLFSTKSQDPGRERPAGVLHGNTRKRLYIRHFWLSGDILRGLETVQLEL